MLLSWAYTEKKYNAQTNIVFDVFFLLRQIGEA